jgi:alkylhydroperoxidase family enzyme
MTLVDHVRADLHAAPVSAKLRALLRIAAAVQRGGKNVRAQDVEAAREAGASDQEIHDTVLIAAAFCMFNRYVDGLATTLPDDPGGYAVAAESIVNAGYAALAG